MMFKSAVQKCFGLMAIVCITGCAHSTPMTEAQVEPHDATSTIQGAPTPMEFVTYQLVFLIAGPNAEGLSDERLAEIQVEHRAHLRLMSEQGHMLVAGPFSDQDDPSLRGLCLYQTEGVEEARALAEADPAVKAGRLKVEVTTWWTTKEALKFPWAEKNAEELQ